MARTGMTLVWCLLLVLDARAGEPPVRGRPPDYSGIVGAYQISSSADVVEVEVEQPVLLTVVITGRGPKDHQPRQDKLKIFPVDVDAEFFIEPVPELAKTTPEKGRWQFVYRLRPKSTEVKFIPTLKLVMYDPAPARYQSEVAVALELKVKPATPREILLDPLRVVDAPESFFELRSAKQESRPDRAFAFRLWVGIFLGTPLGCLVLFSWWRLRNPDAARVRARQRSAAAHQALVALQAGPASANAIAAIAVTYLRQRLDFPAHEATAAEVTRFLARRGLSKDLQKRWQAFCRNSAAERFAGADNTSLEPLRAEAAALVQAMEDQECAQV